jgi:putative ABC transport system substrate-binding protein
VKRRDFITLLGCAPAWPVAAPAQPAMPVIGYLGSFAPTGTFLAAFRKGLADSGYVEGRNVAIDYVTDSQYDRLPIIAADFARRQVALIVAVSTPRHSPRKLPRAISRSCSTSQMIRSGSV